jgi:uncharacterized OsmC-like protein
MAISQSAAADARMAIDPATARSAPVVTATLGNGHARVTAGSFNWDADLPPVLGGNGLAPTPTAYLLGALAACGVVFLRDTLAPQFGVTIDDVTATASAVSDLRGLVGAEGILPDLGDLRLAIEVVSADPPERTEPMLAAWRARCPILLSLVKSNDVALVATVRTPV